MLIRFKVGNFMSFNEAQELSMISGTTRDHSDHIHKFEDVSVLRASAVYGANASGKSNLIRALWDSVRMITFGDPIQSSKYFRPGPSNKDKPSYFEYEFENNGKYYSYGFEFLLSKQKIESEWLYGLKPDRENEVLFQRFGNRIEHTFKGEDKKRVDIYAADMEGNDTTLFLTEMNRKTRTNEDSLSALFDAFNWFSKKTRVFSVDFFFFAKKGKEKEIAEIMGALDTGITGAYYERIERGGDRFRTYSKDLQERLIREKKRNPKADPSFSSGDGEVVSLSENNDLIVERLMFNHANSSASFSFTEESEGTQRLYGMLARILSDEADSIYIMDELDIKLHPQLTFWFVEMFLREKAGTKSQLIFTTHESYLMDFELLRRDEIWFVQRNEDGSSSLYSLEDFNERTDKKIDKAYFEGRYGGAPVFSTVFPVSSGGKDKTCKK
jgi:AAA15 family ATPase/GTPase